jgi:hypothetical protein
MSETAGPGGMVAFRGVASVGRLAISSRAPLCLPHENLYVLLQIL